MELVGKYIGRKFVTASIYAINWSHNTLRGGNRIDTEEGGLIDTKEGDFIDTKEGNLIDTEKHQNSIMRAQYFAGLIGSVAGGTIITSVVNSNSSEAEKKTSKLDEL